MKYLQYLFFFLISLSTAQAEEAVNGAVLQASISVEPATQRNTVLADSLGKIHPGSQMKLIAVVKNSGTELNQPGTLYLRFNFPEPLTNQPNSVLIKTEPVKVPSITPGQEVALTFITSQNWPSLFDFIRHDWGMRQYEAVLVLDDKEYIIGTLPILFSAYYYEGPGKEIPAQIPAARSDETKRSTLSRGAHIRPGVRNRQPQQHRPHEAPGNRG